MAFFALAFLVAARRTDTIAARCQDDPVTVYAAAEAYSLAFSYRDIPAEVEALAGWAGFDEPAFLLELGAGPADHAIEFARRGWRATALDLAPEMCALAIRNAGRLGVALTVVEGDMRDFARAESFDLAVLMLDSASHLLSPAELAANLTAVHDHLNPGGCYIIEFSYPQEPGEESRTHSDWTMTDGDRRVHIEWGRPSDPYDPDTRITDVHVRLEYSAGPLVVEEVVPSRNWTEAEVRAAVGSAGGYAIEHCYGDFTAIALDDPEAWRMIFVLRRTTP